LNLKKSYTNSKKLLKMK